MQIAVDGRYFCSLHRSLALYTANLLRALGELYPATRPIALVPSELHPISLSIREELADRVRWVSPEKPIKHIGRLLPELRWVHYEIPRLISRLAADTELIIMPYHQPPVRASGAARVVILHDLCGLGSGFPKTKKNYWRHYLRLRAAAHLADAIWPISQATLDDMARRFPAARQRLGPVVYNGLDKKPVSLAEIDRTLLQHGLTREGYVLAFATWQERKNFATSLSALVALRREGLSMRLVGIAPEGERESILERCHAVGETDAIILSGVSDKDLDALYAGALGLLWPSTCEGFGYPVVEAMAQGCPPVVGRVGPGAELIGNAWDPVQSLDAASIAERLHELQRARPEDRAQLATSLRRRASEFSLESFQAQLAAAIASLARSDPR